MLRTRAMRERDEMKMFIKHYRFVLLRVRMPDGLILQGEEREGGKRERERKREKERERERCANTEKHFYGVSLLDLLI